MELSLASVPDNGSEVSDEDDMAPRRRFYHFMQNVAVMKDSLREDVACPSASTVSRVVFHAKGGTSKDGGSVFTFCQADSGIIR